MGSFLAIRYTDQQSNRSFPSWLKPLFQSEANGEAVILTQIKLIFTRKVLHVDWF